jgi:hypothetical protein
LFLLARLAKQKLNLRGHFRELGGRRFCD